MRPPSLCSLQTTGGTRGEGLVHIYLLFLGTWCGRGIPTSAAGCCVEVRKARVRVEESTGSGLVVRCTQEWARSERGPRATSHEAR